VRIPPSLVEECLRQCPSNYVLKGRNRDQDLMVGGNTVYFMQGMGMRYLDLDSWETRPATAQEHREAMIVADALENTHLADGVFFYMERQNVPPVMVMLENLASGLRNSSKAEQFGYQKDCEIFAIRMAQALGINLNPELDSASPLTIYGGAVEAAFRYVEAGIPIQPCSSMTMGSGVGGADATDQARCTDVDPAWAEADGHAPRKLALWLPRIRADGRDDESDAAPVWDSILSRVGLYKLVEKDRLPDGL
jgi:trimethylamine:corrinoid methyltransferase-like protein